jgi:hypothetical protein
VRTWLRQRGKVGRSESGKVGSCRYQLVALATKETKRLKDEETKRQTTGRAIVTEAILNVSQTRYGAEATTLVVCSSLMRRKDSDYE